jgi:hypothetical protein
MVAISRGRFPPPRPLHLARRPDVSRLCPVQGRLSKARCESRVPAQSKATERMFGRGRQSANPRIPGGLVSSTRGNASSPARSTARMWPRAANGQQLLLLRLLPRDHCVLPSHVRELTVQRPAHSPDPSRPACRRLGFRAGTSPSTPGALGPHRGVRWAAALPGADLQEATRESDRASWPGWHNSSAGCGWSMAASGGRRVARPRSSWSATSSAWTATSPRSST